MVALIPIITVAVIVIITLARTIRIVPQAQAGVVERFGRYSRTLTPGLTLVVPFVDRIRALIDLREQVVSFPPQPVITEDNLVVNIDSVIYFQVTDAKAATYEIANYIQAIEQLTVTTLRNVVGGMSLEATLTSRDSINNQLRGVLDEATGKWGVRVNRGELKANDPPATIQEARGRQPLPRPTRSRSRRCGRRCRGRRRRRNGLRTGAAGALRGLPALARAARAALRRRARGGARPRLREQPRARQPRRAARADE